MLVFSVQVAVFVGLLLLHVFNDELQRQRGTEERLFQTTLKSKVRGHKHIILARHKR